MNDPANEYRLSGGEYQDGNRQKCRYGSYPFLILSESLEQRNTNQKSQHNRGSLKKDFLTHLLDHNQNDQKASHCVSGKMNLACQMPYQHGQIKNPMRPQQGDTPVN